MHRKNKSKTFAVIENVKRTDNLINPEGKVRSVDVVVVDGGGYEGL